MIAILGIFFHRGMLTHRHRQAKVIVNQIMMMKLMKKLIFQCEFAKKENEKSGNKFSTGGVQQSVGKIGDGIKRTYTQETYASFRV